MMQIVQQPTLQVRSPHDRHAAEKGAAPLHHRRCTKNQDNAAPALSLAHTTSACWQLPSPNSWQMALDSCWAVGPSAAGFWRLCSTAGREGANGSVLGGEEGAPLCCNSAWAQLAQGSMWQRAPPRYAMLAAAAAAERATYCPKAERDSPTASCPWPREPSRSAPSPGAQRC